MRSTSASYKAYIPFTHASVVRSSRRAFTTPVSRSACRQMVGAGLTSIVILLTLVGDLRIPHKVLGAIRIGHQVAKGVAVGRGPMAAEEIAHTRHERVQRRPPFFATLNSIKLVLRRRGM